MSANPNLQKMRLSSGIDLAFQSAGDPNRSALVLLHGLPNSSRNFRDVIKPLSQSGHGPQWATTKEFWSAPNATNEKAATAHLSLEGTRDTYIRGVPADIAARIDPRQWEEDWRVMCLPGRMETERSLLVDYGRYVAQFDAIAAYLKTHQPPAVMVWGRHDAFFDIAEIRSWLEDLPRMEAHILDGPHLLLETHAAKAAALIQNFLDEKTALP